MRASVTLEDGHGASLSQDTPIMEAQPSISTNTTSKFFRFKSPSDVDQLQVHDGGALRAGGAPRLFSREYIGLVAQYAAVGLIDGILPSTIYPFLQNYLNLPGAQTKTAYTLVALPWSFKVFYGILSDCFPIFGYRRRPYMILGWIVCVGMLLLLAATPVGKPYFMDPRYRHVKPEHYTAEIEATLNRDAATRGGPYVLLMMFCAFGYLLSDVCADGVVVELAQREPLAVRGTTQTTIYGTRTAFNVVALVVLAVAFNGKDYGGDFEFSLSFPALMLVLACALTPIIPITWFFIQEERYSRAHLRTYATVLWQILQTRAVYQVIAYQFFHGLFNNFSYTSANPIQQYWVHVTPLNEKLSGLLANGVFAMAIWTTGRYGLQWNWRVMPMITTLTVVAIDAVCTMCTVWDVVRSQWFWLGLPILEQLPLGISFIVSTFITVELAAEGHEGAMYGLLTTVTNLSNPFATALTKNVNSLFDLSTERLQNDTTDVRADVTMTILFMYAMNLLSLGWIVLLPRQKEETQALRRRGGSSRIMGCFTVAYLGFSLIWSVTTNVMGIFQTTACLAIAGGTGCKT